MNPRPRKGIAMRAILHCLAASLFLASCAPIEHTVEAQQMLNRTLVAGPGDVVIRVNKQRNLENVFGASDIYGRKTNEGFSEVRFAGVDADGTLVFFRTDVAIATNETTLTRTPFQSSVASTSGNISPSGSFSSITTSQSLGRPSDYHAIIPAGSIEIRLPKGAQTLIFEGFTVSIMRADAGSVAYSLQRSN